VTVAVGASMLGRFAADTSSGEHDRIWGIMSEMTPVGSRILPNITNREKRLCEAKYRIFLDAVAIQRRWRDEVDAAIADD